MSRRNDYTQQDSMLPGLFAVCLGVLISFVAYGASTGSSALHTPAGRQAPVAFGDFVAGPDSGGLNTYYRYFIEVPPETSELVVDLYDADVGMGACVTENNEQRDKQRGPSSPGCVGPGAGFNTTFIYTLFTPAGVQEATATGDSSSPTGSDDAWWNLATVSGPAAGHWELRVDASAPGSGNDVNALGIRAYDGTGNEDGDGVELPIYAESYVNLGANNTSETGPATDEDADTRVYDVYPWVTAGCRFDANDWDADSGSTPNVTSSTYTSRDSGATATFSVANGSLSGNKLWVNNEVSDASTNWTTDDLAVGYGIWTGDITISSYPEGNGNYVTFFFGWENTADATGADGPPTAQPEADTFRIYLPTDTGNEPLKPYIEQLLTNTFLAQDPPAQDETTQFSVTLRVVNPTAHAITFSAPDDVVTAFIPGGQVVYADNAQATAGTTIVSEPTVGFGGDFVWNPGTVAAGATVIAAYEIEVTPTGTGRLPVTGTVSSNGTVAQYLDETGASQARATYAFGPLCELAITPGMTTYAAVSEVRALRHADGVIVEWQTHGEVGTAYFELQRRDGDRWVTAAPRVPGLLTAPQGGRYRVLDEGVGGKTHEYRIIEHDHRGATRSYGPWVLEPETATANEVTNLSEAHLPRYRRAAEKDTGGLNVHRIADVTVGAGESGLYRVSLAEISALTGRSEFGLRRAFQKERLRLSDADGQKSWLYRDDPGFEGVYFYGEALVNPYTRFNAYTLRPGQPGSEIDSVRGPAFGVVADRYRHWQIIEEDVFPGTVIGVLPDTGFWYWLALMAGHATGSSADLDVMAYSPLAGTAALRARLQGASSDPVIGDHSVEFAVNGTYVGETTWDGFEQHNAEIEFDSGLLVDGNNVITLTATFPDGVATNIFYLDQVAIGYPRPFEALDGQLRFSLDQISEISASSFIGNNVVVLDISDPAHPQQIRVAPAKSGIVDVVLSAGEYLIADLDSARTPDWQRQRSTSNIKRNLSPVDYLIITPSELRDGAEYLAQHRGARGLSTAIVELTEIQDVFAAGRPVPESIRDFLSWIRAHWARPPLFVVLLGRGSLDHDAAVVSAGGVMPVLLGATREGLYASDNAFVGVDEDGQLPFAIGRIPAASNAGIVAYVDKLKSVELSKASVSDSALFVAGSDPDGRFATDVGEITRGLSVEYDVISLDAIGQELARDQVIDALNGGLGLMMWVGHGGIDRMSGLLNNEDVAGLVPNSELPVVVGLSCIINRFELDGFSSLGETLILSPGVGAMAVWAPSGVAIDAESAVLGALFLDAAYGDVSMTVGEAMREALNAYSLAPGADGDIGTVYTLMGDPAVLIRAPGAFAGPGFVPGDPGE